MLLRLLLVHLVACTTFNVVRSEDCAAEEATVVTDSSTIATLKTEGCTEITAERNKHEFLESDGENTLDIVETETTLPEIGLETDQVKCDVITEIPDGEKHETFEIDSVNGVKTGEKHEVNIEKSSQFSVRDEVHDEQVQVNSGFGTADINVLGKNSIGSAEDESKSTENWWDNIVNVFSPKKSIKNKKCE